MDNRRSFFRKVAAAFAGLPLVGEAIAAKVPVPQPSESTYIVKLTAVASTDGKILAWKDEGWIAVPQPEHLTFNLPKEFENCVLKIG